MCKSLRTSPSVAVTLLCVSLFVCNVGAAAVGAAGAVSEPHRQVADEAERLPNIDLQAAEEELEELIRSLDLENGVLDQILPRWVHHRSAQPQRPSSAGPRTSAAAYQRKPLADWPWLRPAATKRNAELINSLLGLPRIMKVVG